MRNRGFQTENVVIPVRNSRRSAWLQISIGDFSTIRAQLETKKLLAWADLETGLVLSRLSVSYDSTSSMARERMDPGGSTYEMEDRHHLGRALVGQHLA